MLQQFTRLKDYIKLLESSNKDLVFTTSYGSFKIYEN